MWTECSTEVLASPLWTLVKPSRHTLCDLLAGHLPHATDCWFSQKFEGLENLDRFASLIHKIFNVCLPRLGFLSGLVSVAADPLKQSRKLVPNSFVKISSNCGVVLIHSTWTTPPKICSLTWWNPCAMWWDFFVRWRSVATVDAVVLFNFMFAFTRSPIISWRMLITHRVYLAAVPNTMYPAWHVDVATQNLHFEAHPIGHPYKRTL